MGKTISKKLICGGSNINDMDHVMDSLLLNEEYTNMNVSSEEMRQKWTSLLNRDEFEKYFDQIQQVLTTMELYHETNVDYEALQDSINFLDQQLFVLYDKSKKYPMNNIIADIINELIPIHKALQDKLDGDIMSHSRAVMSDESFDFFGLP